MFLLNQIQHQKLNELLEAHVALHPNMQGSPNRSGCISLEKKGASGSPGKTMNSQHRPPFQSTRPLTSSEFRDAALADLYNQLGWRMFSQKTRSETNVTFKSTSVEFLR